MDSPSLKVICNQASFKSLTVVKEVKKGEFLCDLWGVVSPVGMHTVQVDKEKHILPASNLSYTNHSCDPNAEFVFKPRNGITVPKGKELSWYLVARREIKQGEEVTFDYTLTEYDMNDPFECKCGADDCLGTVRGFKYLNNKQQQERLAHISPAIKKIVNN
ncbi:predicted protein [Nematostella vectensis]|uniref:Histone-lysine N-methyltransferase n=1 Tax=Nematostella vectensis TaxID=45351 RepID=A7T0S8_NEMVE|nr:methyltransferase flvH [Nematostella vectensis]EDO30436.1 predicted protein [Nematostella vectensis]|eukprot:XP_001622536.1 predicted protein [Nematostella vectensis]